MANHPSLDSAETTSAPSAVPPLQPNPPSPSTDSPPAAQLPLPASDAAAHTAESEGELRADAAADAAPDGVGDCAAEIDPDALVAFGDRDAEAEWDAWVQGSIATALGHAAEPKASGGPPFLGWFADGAVPAETGRYRFHLDREQLLAAVTHLAAFAGRPKKSTPTVRIALREDLCKLSVAGNWGQSVAIALPLKETADGFEPGDAPVAFTMPIPKLVDIVRSGEPGVPERLELNGARRRLLIRGRRELLRVHAGMPNQLMQLLTSR